MGPPGMKAGAKMDIFRIVGFAVVAALLAVLLRSYRAEYAMLIGLGAGAMILIVVIGAATPVFTQIRSLMDQAHVDSRYVTILLKALGICFLTQLACDCCRDAGETAIASKVEMAGKFAVLLIAMPLFLEVAELAIRLME